MIQMRSTKSRERKTYIGKRFSLSNGKKKRGCSRRNGRERNKRDLKLRRVSHTYYLNTVSGLGAQRFPRSVIKHTHIL